MTGFKGRRALCSADYPFWIRDAIRGALGNKSRDVLRKDGAEDVTEKQQPNGPERRATVRYEGMVQGVGFRFTVLQLCRRFAVTGYVLNEYDGSVRVVAEGAEPEVLAFLRAIKLSSLNRYIVRESVTWSEATGEFDSFEVRYAR